MLFNRVERAEELVKLRFGHFILFGKNVNRFWLMSFGQYIIDVRFLDALDSSHKVCVKLMDKFMTLHANKCHACIIINDGIGGIVQVEIVKGYSLMESGFIHNDLVSV